MLSSDLTNRVAIVTGATLGIGHGIALTLAEAGAQVVVVSRDPDRVEAVSNEVRALGGRADGRDQARRGGAHGQEDTGGVRPR